MLDNSTKAISRVERFNCIVCGTDTFKCMRDEMVNRELSFHITFDQDRDICSTLKSSKGGTLPGTARNKLEGPSRNLVTRGSNSDYAGRAPSTMRALKSGTHNLGITCAIETIVNSPLGHDSSNVFLDRSLDRSWVEAIRRTKLLGVLELIRIEVDGNDFGGTGHLGTLDNSETLWNEKEMSL
jgi:hypothetical protein